MLFVVCRCGSLLVLLSFLYMLLGAVCGLLLLLVACVVCSLLVACCLLIGDDCVLRVMCCRVLVVV